MLNVLEEFRQVDEEKFHRIEIEKDLGEYEELLKLHRGEISTLLAARELGLKQVVVDDKKAIKAAKYNTLVYIKPGANLSFCL